MQEEEEKLLPLAMQSLLIVSVCSSCEIVAGNFSISAHWWPTASYLYLGSRDPVSSLGLCRHQLCMLCMFVHTLSKTRKHKKQLNLTKKLVLVLHWCSELSSF